MRIKIPLYRDIYEHLFILYNNAAISQQSRRDVIETNFGRNDRWCHTSWTTVSGWELGIMIIWVSRPQRTCKCTISLKFNIYNRYDYREKETHMNVSWKGVIELSVLSEIVCPFHEKELYIYNKHIYMHSVFSSGICWMLIWFSGIHITFDLWIPEAEKLQVYKVNILYNGRTNKRKYDEFYIFINQ